MTATAISSLGEVTEVPEKARRRAFTVEYKRKIVKEAEPVRGPARLEHCFDVRGCSRPT